MGPVFSELQCVHIEYALRYIGLFPPVLCLADTNVSSFAAFISVLVATNSVIH
jgi:hypothetical protein